MNYAQSSVRTGQLASGLSAQPLSQLAVDGQALPASCSIQDWLRLCEYQAAAMRSKEAITAMVIGAAALAAHQPGLIVSGQDALFMQYGSAPAFCMGTSSATAVSGSSTSTPLQSVGQNVSFTSNPAGYGLPLACMGGVSKRVALQSGDGVCTGLDDSTSPLSASSRVGIGGVPTPCGSEALSGPQLGGKRSFDQAFQQQQVQYQQQGLFQQQLQKPQAALLLQHKQFQQTQQSLVQQQQVQLQASVRLQQAALQTQQAALNRQQVQQQQHHTHKLLNGHESAGVIGRQQQQQQGYLSSAAFQQQLNQPKQQLLVSQSSVTSSNSCGASLAGYLNAPSCGAPAQSFSEYLGQQKSVSKLLTSDGCVQQQQQQQPWLVGVAPAAVVLDEIPAPTSTGSSSWTAYLHRLQEQSLQPPCKRAATTAAVSAAAALVNASIQQQQVPGPAVVPALAAVTAPSYISSNSMQQAAGLSTSHHLLLPSPASHDSQLLAWAGQVLNCQLSDAYHLAQHIYSRAAAQLDDMLLITLGVTQPMDKVTMLVSLWMATKLEGHRRQVVGCSKLATALQMVPWAVTSVELHVMQALEWRPYAGFAGHASCVVSEL